MCVLLRLQKTLSTLRLRYVKGRISYKQVNDAIDEIHKAIGTKYKILRIPRTAMGEPMMKKYKVRLQ